jgi:hypothetical protein
MFISKKKELKKNLKIVFTNRRYLILSMIFFIFLSLLFSYFTDSEYIINTKGYLFYFLTFISQFTIAILFSIFLSISIYKYTKFSKFDVSENSSSILGTFLAVLVTGCPACSITLASYLGLASILSFLPFFGLELKIIGIFLLLYANYSILTSLTTCKIKKVYKK